jgi:hypothetical protein
MESSCKSQDLDLAPMTKKAKIKLFSLTYYNQEPFSKTKNGILLPKLFWPTVRKKWSSDQEKLLKFEAKGQEFAKNLRSLEQFIQTVKGQNNFR